MDRLQAAAAREFWVSFCELAPRLALLEAADDAVYDALLAALQAVHPQLYFEFSVGPTDKELVITAHGERSLFSLVRAVVEVAPVVDEWSIIALKQKLGFPESMTWNGVTVATRDVFVRIYRRRSGGFDLDIFVRGLDERDGEDAHNAILGAMDHGVGEEQLAEQVIGTQLVFLPPGESPDAFVPLTDLADVLAPARGSA